ncbi:hypothetical protein H632_c202p0 [Helicosporidium sp. ATCC 50920]|nr:hypothetical protein H632_c202p0 [Helicosporidium sp. ATCC 50920]|eukprot:KDD76503.1 hypothetical protein H632_c202p0 [Helicosporidium sp. ATCC 50920]
MTTMEDLKKLKVAELRDELTKRDLETKGVKDELIARLWESMSAEQPDASTPAPENAPDPVASPPAEHLAASTTEADVPAPAKAAVEAIPAPPVKLSEADKSKLRAERFGLPVAEGAKDKPAASSSVGSLGKAETQEEMERRKKRAERFGMPVPMTKEEEWAKKKQRAAKFGLPAPVFKEEEEAKRQSRQNRFGAGNAVGGSTDQVAKKLAARAERFGMAQS